MKKAEIFRNAKIEEQIFSTIKFDDRHSERKTRRDRSYTIEDLAWVSWNIYVMFDVVFDSRSHLVKRSWRDFICDILFKIEVIFEIGRANRFIYKYPSNSFL